MKEIQYRKFSRRTHRKNLSLQRPNVCQFELTFKCPLHCRHCYSECYNQPACFKGELNTQEVKLILDKAHQAGVIWVCFTGGDPLSRNDFSEIYSYAKEKGFITTVFTSGYLLDSKIIKLFESRPPFVVELTLNAVTQELYEKISQVKGSFPRVMQAIDLLIKHGVPVKIKTQVTKDNFQQLPGIKSFIERLGLEFHPNYILYPRLNKDPAPCNLRISPQEILGLGAGNESLSACEDCSSLGFGPRTPSADLFTCAIAGKDGFYIDPYGNIFFCLLLRKSGLNLLKTGIDQALNQLSPQIRNTKFLTDTKCRDCSLRSSCLWCPGKAYLEKSDPEAPLDYYCRLVRLQKMLEKEIYV
ncbi:radical SAM protein [Candidatus Omnitrophota bacterium]